MAGFPWILSVRFLKSVRACEKTIQVKTWKALDQLSRDRSTPGLRVEKVKGTPDRWSARVDLKYRLIFQILRDSYSALHVGPHDDAFSEAVSHPALPPRRMGSTSVPSPAPIDDQSLSIPGGLLSKASKYFPLAESLLTEPDSRSRVELQFGEIESMLGAALPASARKHRAWWANDVTHVQALAWLGAGWRVVLVDLSGERVGFERRDLN